MADASQELPLSTNSEVGDSFRVQATVAPELTVAESLQNEWYVRVKAEYRGTALSQVKDEIILETEQRVVALHEGHKFPFIRRQSINENQV